MKKNKKLTVLDLSFNEITKLNEFRFFILYYIPLIKTLNKINVEKAELTNAKNYFDGRITSELLDFKLGSDITTDIVEVDLSNCKLKDFENIFSSFSFPKVKKLNISRNMFSNFKIFGNCPYIYEINLSYNLFDKFMNKLEKTVPNKGLMGILVIIV